MGVGFESRFRFLRGRSGRNLIIAIGAIDNLGKALAGMAVQNANLMFDLAQDAGLSGAPLWP